jgi:hypothetical protein
MSKGVIYLMTTAVSGLIKIGKTGAYQGAQYFTYNGKKLVNLPDKI